MSVSTTPDCGPENPSSAALPSSTIAKGKPEESEKFKMRRARIRKLEQEQVVEDEVAVRVIQALHSSTIMPIESCVRTDFCDLDGLSWSDPSVQDQTYDYRYILSPVPDSPHLITPENAQEADGLPCCSGLAIAELAYRPPISRTESELTVRGPPSPSLSPPTSSLVPKMTRTSYRSPPGLDIDSLAEHDTVRFPSYIGARHLLARSKHLGNVKRITPSRMLVAMPRLQQRSRSVRL
ncbi:unnamed protein product [Somion occarium]|uniref:Uncharacterized protein n=1 Tax=Somion occarium TaxID=3059160 RepID=A0ABP1DDD9_9APHY